MILNVSGRTDVVAFYTPWFINRYREGYVDVRNPFNPKLVNRIHFEDVDAIMFCSKNPKPILSFLKGIDKPIIFHVTLTPYKFDIEPNVPPKNEIIESIKELSKIIGIDNVFVRFDPIFISDIYNVQYHLKVFDRMCFLLNGYVKKIIVSFIDEYKNVNKNKKYLRYHDITEEEYKLIGMNFSASAKKYGMTVQTCFEKRNLGEYGFVTGECISKEFAYSITGKKYKKWAARDCGCIATVDIGAYNSCKHLCKYCYANYDEKKVIGNCKKHDVNSSLLLGHIEKDDIIKVRKK